MLKTKTRFIQNLILNTCCLGADETCSYSICYGSGVLHICGSELLKLVSHCTLHFLQLPITEQTFGR